ncbi:DUF6078 family protein [uncultured Bacteroides sp.]|uniref:DUF6078 family protein n=1 Tax=uncultured Bacteroides sp. TaxID=162156 RepID=UPI00259AD68E|nr:DUF6078 family protein [uncultured Bacteroides sp.]
MKENINYTQIPFDYALCLDHECPKAANCLRQLSAQSMPADKDYWNIVSPKRLAALKGDCPFFRTCEKVRYAKGFMNLLDNLPYNKRRTVISCLIAHFGQRTYYRIRKGERLLSPDEQRTVLNIIGQPEANIESAFDAYVEGYAW